MSMEDAMVERMARRVLSADDTLNEALITAAHINDLGIEAYTQNGASVIAEVSARAALANAVTNRIRLLNDLLEQRPAVVYGRENMVSEFQNLIRSVTHG